MSSLFFNKEKCFCSSSLSVLKIQVNWLKKIDLRTPKCRFFSLPAFSETRVFFLLVLYYSKLFTLLLMFNCFKLSPGIRLLDRSGLLTRILYNFTGVKRFCLWFTIKPFVLIYVIRKMVLYANYYQVFWVWYPWSSNSKSVNANFAEF